MLEPMNSDLVIRDVRRLSHTVVAFCGRHAAANLVLLLGASAMPIYAQSADPDVLRRIIAEKNAAAARETWGGGSDVGSLPTSPYSGSGFGTSQPWSAPGGTAGGSAASAGAGWTDSSSHSSSTSVTPVVTSFERPASAPRVHAPSVPAAVSVPVVSPAIAASVALPPRTMARPAEITYAGGKLSVRAQDSSLNTILAEIARLTGMVIDGGVADDRVFGLYGPAGPADVVASLLRGSTVNVFLKQGPHATVARLSLTAR